MLEHVSPSGIAAPLANYSHATVVPPNARWLFASGQLGVRPDGGVPDSVDAQTAQAFENVLAILAEAGMGATDLVRLTTYLTDRADLPVYMAVRDGYVGTPPPASTLVVVHALARPQFKVEIEAVAARSDSDGV